jgi:protein-L-isoaspartate(D-aspartate) O-methyltransferase
MQDFSLARRAMVDSQLRPEAVTDRGVLAAMASVERENFVPESAKALAYFDRPLPLTKDRAMMPPAALGRLLSELAPRPGERALIVGSGTG